MSTGRRHGELKSRIKRKDPDSDKRPEQFSNKKVSKPFPLQVSPVRIAMKSQTLFSHHAQETISHPLVRHNFSSRSTLHLQ